ncbi:nuclear transport factor 2 family protein [Methylovorus sp. SPW-M1]|jgi:hypothetical protein
MNEAPSREEAIELARTFLVTMDVHKDFLSLMTDDVELTFPKLGTVKGKMNLGSFFQALGSYVAAISHRPETFKFLVGESNGNMRVCIEGLSKGRLQNGKTWDAGRFSVIYEFRGRLVSHIGIYIDPDYVDATNAYYPWNTSEA